ncbi:hypothetical protein CRG98_025763 [Punica granatum]|uniref:Uncharacterized protein n=1 Tax=Punica granatum TaxID=22663 RepID=A0A2I0JC84_PUNGR|nr:hypothetical protein CRG98_025763 [Punica granatum]
MWHCSVSSTTAGTSGSWGKQQPILAQLKGRCREVEVLCGGNNGGKRWEGQLSAFFSRKQRQRRRRKPKQSRCWKQRR